MPTFRERIKYGTAFDATITIASLASDTNLLAGAESDAIDNSAEGYSDLIVSGKITTGSSPTANRVIEVWAVGSWDGTSWPSVFDGTASAETIPLSNVKNAICKFIASILITSTNNVEYHFACASVAAAFGGILPASVVFFVTQSSAVALNSTTGNHQIRVQPVYRQIESV